MKIAFKKPLDITLLEKREMYDLYSRYHELPFEDYEKNFTVYGLYFIGYKKGKIVAIVGVDISLLEHTDSKLVSIYFGAASVERSCRRSGFIPKVVIRSILLAIIKYPFYKKYLWCLAATYKPYMFYSKMLKSGYPRRGVTPDQEVLAIRDVLIRHCPLNLGQVGWLNRDPIKWHLKDDANRIGERDLLDPDIRFYNSFNIPENYGLFTYAPATLENFLYYFRYYFRKKCSTPFKQGAVKVDSAVDSTL